MSAPTYLHGLGSIREEMVNIQLALARLVTEVDVIAQKTTKSPSSNDEVDAAQNARSRKLWTNAAKTAQVLTKAHKFRPLLCPYLNENGKACSRRLHGNQALIPHKAWHKRHGHKLA